MGTLAFKIRKLRFGLLWFSTQTKAADASISLETGKCQGGSHGKGNYVTGMKNT